MYMCMYVYVQYAYFTNKILQDHFGVVKFYFNNKILGLVKNLKGFHTNWERLNTFVSNFPQQYLW